MQLTKNLIFDLGGVIIELDLERSIDTFGSLVTQKTDDFRQAFWKSDFLTTYEVGRCTDVEFRQNVCDFFQTSMVDSDVDRAWNALLLHIPAERIALLKQLRKNHNLYLLSNTNAIHVKAVNQILYEQHQIENLNLLFDKVYYSHELGKRKPNAEIYEHVLADAGIKAEDSIFFDDSPLNVNGAEQVGIQTVLIKPQEFTIIDFFQPLS